MTWIEFSSHVWLVGQNSVKQKSYDGRFKKFSQLIFKISLPGTITFIYKLDQVCTNDAQKNY